MAGQDEIVEVEEHSSKWLKINSLSGLTIVSLYLCRSL